MSNNEEGKGPVEEKTEGSQEPVVEAVKVKPASGEEITLKDTDLAILVVVDPVSSITTVSNVQNCPSRAYAKMVLREALDMYALVTQVKTTMLSLETMFKKAGKKGLELPWGEKK